MRRQDQALRQLNVKVAVVTFEADAMAKAYVKDTNLEWPLLIDSDRSLYRSYQMERANLWSIYTPSSVWHYVKLLFQGHRLRRPGSDTLQLGGDVLIDPNGIVRYHYTSVSPHDRPSPESILAIVERGGTAEQR